METDRLRYTITNLQQSRKEIQAQLDLLDKLEEKEMRREKMEK